MRSMAEQRAALEPEGITITRMSEHDLLEIVEIEEQSGLSRWGWAAYYAELQGANRDLMLIARPTSASIVEPGPIAGYIVARETAGELHINNVAVRAEYQASRHWRCLARANSPRSPASQGKCGLFGGPQR